MDKKMNLDFPNHVGAVVVYQPDFDHAIPMVRNSNGNWVTKYNRPDDPQINDLVMWDLRRSYPGYYPLCFDSMKDYVEYQSWMSLDKGLGLVCDELDRRNAS